MMDTSNWYAVKLQPRSENGGAYIFHPPLRVAEFEEVIEQFSQFPVAALSCLVAGGRFVRATQAGLCFGHRCRPVDRALATGRRHPREFIIDELTPFKKHMAEPTGVAYGGVR